jgi:mannosyl-oligosaccharide alpha-1,2-mannosidase
MYEKAADVAKDKLLFRPMIPNSKREVLVSGTLHVSVPANPDLPPTERLSYGGSHLTCFAGGMFALGAKLFDRKEDLDIAAKLTDGCVWAYETTASGIMPETFVAIPCEDRKECSWNETKWWDELDPNPEWRMESYDSQMNIYKAQLEEQKLLEEQKAFRQKKKEDVFEAVQTPEPGALPVKGKEAPKDRLKSPSNLEKRQLDDALGSKIAAEIKLEHMQALKGTEEAPTTTKEPESVWTPPTSTLDEAPPALYSPEKPLTHEEYAKQLIEEDRIPPGMRNMNDKRYILR